VEEGDVVAVAREAGVHRVLLALEQQRPRVHLPGDVLL
jgi:hypothetical protein